MRKLILLTALLLPSLALAQQWEYRVIHIGVPMDAKGMVPKVDTSSWQKEGGHYVVPHMTDELNALAAQGWEVVGVTGNNISSNIILRRRIN